MLYDPSRRDSIETGGYSMPHHLSCIVCGKWLEPKRGCGFPFRWEHFSNETVVNYNIGYIFARQVASLGVAQGFTPAEDDDDTCPGRLMSSDVYWRYIFIICNIVRACNLSCQGCRVILWCISLPMLPFARTLWINWNLPSCEIANGIGKGEEWRRLRLHTYFR